MKPCKSCKQGIHDEASKCNICQSHQNWKRYVGDVNLISIFALTSTILAIGTGYTQLNGVSQKITTLENKNILLTGSNSKKNTTLTKVSFILEDLEGKLERSNKKSNQMEEVISIQEKYIKKLDYNLTELTNLIDDR